jgi:hypothetical protein
MTVFCKDCKHIAFIDKRMVCKANPDLIDYVTGVTKYDSASYCRTTSKCGKSGSKFEYSGVFGPSCRTCDNYHKPDNSCSAFDDDKRKPIGSAIRDCCGSELRNYKRNIWLTIANVI